MKQVIDTADKLTKRARRIERALKFWLALHEVTKFGLHGFVLWRIRRNLEKAQANNSRAVQVNRELRRVRRMRNGRGA